MACSTSCVSMASKSSMRTMHVGSACMYFSGLLCYAQCRSNGTAVQDSWRMVFNGAGDNFRSTPAGCRCALLACQVIKPLFDDIHHQLAPASDQKACMIAASCAILIRSCCWQCRATVGKSAVVNTVPHLHPARSSISKLLDPLRLCLLAADRLTIQTC